MKFILLLCLLVLAGNCEAQIVVSPPPPNATSGKPYSHQFVATGGVAPYTWTAGNLPAGITINSSTGVISGTAVGLALPNTFNIWVRATDSTGAFGTLATTLTLVEPYYPDKSNDSGCTTAEAAGAQTFVWLFLLGAFSGLLLRLSRHGT